MLSQRVTNSVTTDAASNRIAIVIEKLPNRRRSRCIRLSASRSGDGGASDRFSDCGSDAAIARLDSAPLAQSGYLGRLVAEFAQYRVGVLALIRGRAQFIGLG